MLGKTGKEDVVTMGAASGLNVLIGKDCRISGTLSLSGKVELHGSIEGEVSSTGELIIGEPANIDAKVVGADVKVFGKVNGDIECSDRLELKTGAKVYGNISCPNLIIEDGVTFEGHCSMQQKGPTPVPEAVKRETNA